jgi:hypothetical protein
MCAGICHECLIELVRRMVLATGRPGVAGSQRCGAYNPRRIPQSMTLAAGVHLGPYEIVSALGAGGMGEV